MLDGKITGTALNEILIQPDCSNGGKEAIWIGWLPLDSLIDAFLK